MNTTGNDTSALTRDSLRAITEAQAELEKSLGNGAYYQHLAEQLSAVAGKSPPWTGRYVQSVASGTLKPSAAFALAVDAYGATLDDVPQIAAYTVRVLVFAPPGRVRDGSIVLGVSRPCMWPGCKTIFVPRVPWQKYCNADLHRAARANRNRNGHESNEYAV